MGHLSSCYFCGVAVDEPLESFELPGASSKTTVTLCPTCQHKLDTILEAHGVEGTEPASAESEAHLKVSGGETAESESTSSTETEPAETAATFHDEDGEETTDDTDITLDDESGVSAGEPADAESPLIEEAAEAEATDEDVEEEIASELESEMSADMPEEFTQREPSDIEEEPVTDAVEEEPVTDAVEDESPAAVVDQEEQTPADSPEVGETETVAEEDTSEGIDPSILQADEIATGKVDIEEVLGEDVPAEMAEEPETETTGSNVSESAVEESADSESSAESEAVEDTVGVPDTGTETDDVTETDSPDLEALVNDSAEMPPDEPAQDAEDPSRNERVDENPEKTAEQTDTADEDGFDFDREEEQEDDLDSKIKAEMEPEIPDELGTGESGEEAPEQPDPEDSDASSESDSAENEEDSPEMDTVEDDEDSPETDSQADEEPERTRTASISALEYNKVMRLLQNREFPVNRIEIETVASSAYDLSEAECAEVIDIAIDRGLLAEADGELVKPD